MKIIDILNNLIPYQDLSEEILLKETNYLQKKNSAIKLTKNISSSYSFVTIEIIDTHDKNLYCEIKFEIQNNSLPKQTVYCTDPARISEIEKLIRKYPWNENMSEDIFLNDTITKYLAIADEIAAQAYNCTAGDNYRPGNFSEIYIDEFIIKLSQINYMNSKSSAHKNDYSMRKLKFIIPLIQSATLDPWHDYQIGDMMIYFSDSSSKNNKSCGEAIVEKIKTSIISFNQK